MPASLGFAFPRRLHLTLVSALLSVWALILVIYFTSILSLGRPDHHTKASHLWNSVNTILERAISEHLARHVSTVSGPRYRISRDTVDRITAFQDSLDRTEQLRTFRLSERILGVSDTRRKLSLHHTSTNTTALAARFCAALSAKKMLFVGSENTFYLHSLWLDTLGKYKDRRYHCRGLALCTFHHVCQPLLNPAEPFMDSPRFKKHPTDKELLAGGSSIIRYSLSDSLNTSGHQEDLVYTRPVTDVFSGVRVRNAYWLGHVKRADVVLMGRAPLPAPAWSYTGSGPVSNWANGNQTYHNQSWPYHEGDSLAIRIIQAALHNTLVSFLPTTIHSLDNLRMSLDSQQKVLVWHGSWYRYARCSEIRLSKAELYVEDLLGPLTRVPVLFIDPWSLYYNAQVYIQNRLMRAILPQYGITFLPMVPGSKDYTFRRVCEKENRNRNVLEMHFLETFVTLMEHSVSYFPTEFHSG